MSSDSFERIQVGDEAELTHTITAHDVDEFARLTGDDNPLHMDSKFAQTTSLRQRVVHGMLTASFISTMIGTKLPGKGALWYEQSLKFLRPVRIGQTILVRAKVLHKSLAQRLLVLSTDVLDQDGNTVVSGEAKVKLMEPERPLAPEGAPEKGAIIVTGASRGIGAATARALATAGHPVTVNHRDSQAQAQALVDEIVAAGGRAIVVQADVRQRQDMERLATATVEAFGSLFGVVNNASPPISTALFHETEWATVLDQFEAQVGGAFHLSQAALPFMLAGNSGCIINITSIAAEDVPPAQQCGYVVAKSALNGLTRALAVELGPKNIRVNAVAAGMTHTDFIAGFPEKAKMVAKMQTPLRRLAQAGDIAEVVAFLASDAARHVHGQTIRVCGGSVMA